MPEKQVAFLSKKLTSGHPILAEISAFLGPILLSKYHL